MLAETKTVVNLELTPMEVKQLILLLDDHCETYSAPSEIARFREDLIDMLSELLGEQPNDRYVR